MAHNPYHTDVDYDTSAGNQPTTYGGFEGTGYDFTKKPALEEGEKDLSIYFDPYDEKGEEFAGAGNALNQAYFNDKLSGLTSSTQSDLTNLTQNTPSQGFGRSGGMERNVKNTREDIMRGYTAGKQGIDYQRGRSDLAYQQDIFDMRSDYEKQQKDRLIDLIGADPSNLEKYHEDYKGDDPDTSTYTNPPPNSAALYDGHEVTQNGIKWRWSGSNWENMGSG